jgi:hypothetical protein
MVSAFGKTTLGLTYSLVFGEALLSPAIPSVAARAGGIFFPLAKARAGLWRTGALGDGGRGLCALEAAAAARTRQRSGPRAPDCGQHAAQQQPTS